MADLRILLTDKTIAHYQPPKDGWSEIFGF